MNRTGVMALGEPAVVTGLALAGALVVEAATPAEVRRAWAELSDRVALVILSPAAAEALKGSLDRPVAAANAPLVAVIPR